MAVIPGRSSVVAFVIKLAVSVALLCTLVVLLSLALGHVLPGAEIVYVSSPVDEFGDIFLLDIHHNLTRNLTRSSAANDISPEWSPDGFRLAFASNRNASNYAIYILNLQSGELQQFTATIGYNAFHPDWSPDGRWIFVRLIPQEGGVGDVCAIEVYGAQVNCIAGVNNPAWSPDGTQIAFYKYASETGLAVHVSDPDGRNDRVLTGDLSSVTGRKPAWSPDGRQIAYSLQGNIYLMNADGTNPHLLLDFGGSEYNVTWSNDGQFIVFQSDADGDHELYLMELATGTVRRLTDNADLDYSPAWRP